MEKCLVCGNTSFKKFMVKDGYDYHRCKCGLEFIFPQPTDEALIKIYGKSYYDNWGLDDNESHVRALKYATFRKRLDRVKSYLTENSNILDCGCATGYFLDVVKEEGFNSYGIEISEYSAGICKKKFGEKNIFQGEIELAEFEDDIKFDAIFMSDYIEHVRNPESVLKKIKSMLKANGIIVITTPQVKSVSYHIFSKGWMQYKSEHLFYFSKRTISGLLKKTGYDIIEISKAGKYVSLFFIFRHFATYPHKVISKLFSLAEHLIPGVLKRKKLYTVLGDMLVIAKN